MLTRSELSYFDGADTAKKKEKGRVALKDVRVVEPVALREGGGGGSGGAEAKPNSFQIGYRDGERGHQSLRPIPCLKFDYAEVFPNFLSLPIITTG